MSRLAQLRAKLRRAVAKIAAIRKRNQRRRRAIKRLEAEHGATVMFDSVDLSQIPENAPAVAGYVGGAWPTFNQLRARFPHAYRLSIAVSASEDAVCLDVEPGDAELGQVVSWINAQRARSVKRPVIYSSASGMDAVVRALSDAGIGRESVRLWSAHYTFSPHLCGPHSCGEVRSTTVDATQWTDKALGRNLDQSLVAKGFFG